MATATRKALVSITLERTRETKRTYRFETADEDAHVTSLYVRKSAFNGTVPESVTVTVS